MSPELVVELVEHCGELLKMLKDRAVLRADDIPVLEKGLKLINRAQAELPTL